MPIELTILSNEALPAELIDATGQQLFPGGVLLEYADGEVYQYVTSTEQAVASVFASRRIAARTHVDTLLATKVNDYLWWTEVTVPFGDDGDGFSFTQALAAACAGCIAERI